MQKSTFTVDQKSFLSLLSSLQAICTKRAAVDVTSYILFQVSYKEIILKSTDLEISLQVSYEKIDDMVLEPCTFLVHGRRLFELVKELDGAIACTVSDNQLHLTTELVNVSLHIRNADDFPPFPERIENLMQLDSAFLLDLLNKTAFLIPQNNTNPSLNGLLIELDPSGMKMTATDGHSLVQIRTEAYTLADKRKWLLPRRAVFELKRIMESMPDTVLFVGLCGNQLVFSGSCFNFFTRLLQDQFPEYSSILQRQQFVPARVDRQQLVKTLRRSACLLSGQFLATKFSFSPSDLEISLINKEVGKLQERIPLEEFIGNTLSMRFYAPYLLNGLSIFDQKSIKFYLQNQSKPIIFEAETEDIAKRSAHILYLVMPVAAVAQ
jgi:DNA polymerase-3 subunit beta